MFLFISTYTPSVPIPHQMHVFSNINGTDGITWLRHSGLFVYKSRLFFSSKCCGKATLEEAVRVCSRVKLLTDSLSIAILFTDVEISNNTVHGNLVTASLFRKGNIRSTSHWLRAQRAVKNWASTRVAANKERALAFAMGWHMRLGCQSVMSSVPEELVRVILSRYAEPSGKI